MSQVWPGLLGAPVRKEGAEGFIGDWPELGCSRG